MSPDVLFVFNKLYAIVKQLSLFVRKMTKNYKLYCVIPQSCTKCSKKY